MNDKLIVIQKVRCKGVPIDLLWEILKGESLTIKHRNRVIARVRRFYVRNHLSAAGRKRRNVAAELEVLDPQTFAEMNFRVVQVHPTLGSVSRAKAMMSITREEDRKVFRSLQKASGETGLN